MENLNKILAKLKKLKALYESAKKIESEGEAQAAAAGAVAYLIDFGTRKPTDYPGNAAGLYVGIVEDGEMVELDKDYVKNLFNR